MVGIMFMTVFVYYLIAVALIWLMRRIAMAIREARVLRPGYQDQGLVIFMTDAVLIFIGGKDDGGNVALDIKECAEIYRAFSLAKSRKKYVENAIDALPGLMGSHFKKQAQEVPAETP
jgi:hypothetical protein